jgi:SEC-C motif-containing protein/nuclease-like protein
MANRTGRKRRRLAEAASRVASKQESVPPRPEDEILADLASVCTSCGYAHAVAYFSFRDNVVGFSGELTGKDLQHLYSPDRLIRNEISTLIGLMVKKPVDYELPTPAAMRAYIDRTESLLAELHQALLVPAKQHIAELASGKTPALPFGHGSMLREPMFYGAESAFSFQYRDFSVRKYQSDDPWLIRIKRFSIGAARDVVRTVALLQHEKMAAAVKSMRDSHSDEWTLLPAFTFSAAEVAAASQLDLPTVDAVLAAFTLDPDGRNERFESLNDFNAIAATPLLRFGENLILFQQYNLVEALYESPYYWMADDSDYAATAFQHRGNFTEDFCRERLERVFGKDHVYSDVRLLETKATTISDIDVLVVFGDRALVLQAKSKRLTIKARKGNDGQVREDFKKSVQDAYEQGLACATILRNTQNVRARPSDSRTVRLPPAFKEIYIMCVVSDHYPALAFQAREFLKYNSDDVVRPPFVLDVFALDAIAEFLHSPLRFLSYVNRRVNNAESVLASNEMVILGYHLARNLWVEKGLDSLFLADDFSAELDVAMAARREGLSGARTPDGILTRLGLTRVGRIIEQIEASPQPGPLALGFMLLTLSEDAVRDLGSSIERLAKQAIRDHRCHDITIGLDEGASGLTIHCNDESGQAAMRRLEIHCVLRKYKSKARRWAGVCLDPRDLSVRGGVALDYAWSPDPRLEEASRSLEGLGADAAQARPVATTRVGANDPCPCGSGRKYKKCCRK